MVKLGYVPHGINSELFFPITTEHPDYNKFIDFRNKLFQGEEFDYVVFWNNRNIRRKSPGDLILSYRYFCDHLSSDESKRCLLLLHTDPVDENGTNLFDVIRMLCPKYNVKFHQNHVDSDIMNYLYNLSDVTVNIASNEGFGLSSAESIMSGTPVINNVTGGLQDQMRFEDENGNWIKVTGAFTSNHLGTFSNCGAWAYPVFPSNRSLQGSIPTPYIFDERCNFEDVAKGIMYWYKMGREERKRLGSLGRNWLLSEESGMSSKQMGDNFIQSLLHCMDTFEKRKRFNLLKVPDDKAPSDDLLGIVWKKNIL